MQFKDILRFPSITLHAVGIQMLFHSTAFLHISSRMEGWVQSASCSLFWLNRHKVFSGLVQVCWRYWQPCSVKSQIRSSVLARTHVGEKRWIVLMRLPDGRLVLTSGLPQYQMALMTLWLARAAVSWSLLPVRMLTKPAGRSQAWSTWKGERTALWWQYKFSGHGTLSSVAIVKRKTNWLRAESEF